MKKQTSKKKSKPKRANEGRGREKGETNINEYKNLL